MKNNLLKRISTSLAKSEGIDSKEQTCFYVSDELDQSDIQIEVEAVGQINFPIVQQDIQKLIAISSKAKFGLKDKTLLDESVRDSQEIKADQLHVKIKEDSLDQILNKMRQSLGLADDAKLKCHLHNMLIYQTGQFFRKHQDSEKLDGMVATLVMVLPSAHIGGDLIIKHNDQKYIFSSQNIDSKNTKCLAFYSDCHHEVKEVKDGYRIALTYNLVLESGQIIKDECRNPRLEKAIKDYFSQENPPRQLVYFLDHSYTEHSLKWDMLKGLDRKNASSFYAAASELNLVPHLALAEIHESWIADDGGYDDDPEPTEMIEDDISLSCWMDKNNQKLSFGTQDISNDHICFTKATSALKPFNSEYEGFMGNYGNTMDYWYRRAAVVLWPETDDIWMGFKLNYENSLNELVSLTSKSGQESRALEIIRKAGELLYKKDHKNPKNIFIKFVTIGLYVQNKEVAKSILANFEWEIFNGGIAKHIAKLQKVYGADFCVNLVENWKEGSRKFNQNLLLSNLDLILQNLLEVGCDLKLLELLLSTQIASLIAQDQHSQKSHSPVTLKKASQKRTNLMLDLLKASTVISTNNFLNEVINHVVLADKLYPNIILADIFLQLKNGISPHKMTRYSSLQNHLIKSINEELICGLRPKDDWSIKEELSCRCGNCKIVSEFLRSKTEIKKIWPVVAEVRNHIISTLELLALPLDISVEKTGSPHKLIMEKNVKLHNAAEETFGKLGEYYAAITKDIH